MTSEELLNKLGQQVLSNMKDLLKDAWDGFSPEEKQLVADCARDAGLLAVRQMAGEDVAAEQRQVNAQLANLRSVGASRVKDALWGVLEVALKTAGALFKTFRV